MSYWISRYCLETSTSVFTNFLDYISFDIPINQPVCGNEFPLLFGKGT